MVLLSIFSVRAEMQEHIIDRNRVKLIIYKRYQRKKLLFVLVSFGTSTNVVKSLLCGVSLE